jgi:hypothetical protein
MKTYSLKGKVIDANKDPLREARILAFDEDFLQAGDFLGDAITDSGGVFKITFDQSKFKKPWELLEGKPDVVIVIKDSSGREVLKTKVMKTDKEIEYHVKLNGNKPDPNSIDIYSDNSRRMLATLNAVGANIGLENKINLSRLQSINLPQQVRESIQNYVNGHEDRQNNFQNLMAAVSGIVNETLEQSHLGRIGYDGPQVPRLPRREHYDQVIMWPRKEEFRWA